MNCYQEKNQRPNSKPLYDADTSSQLKSKKIIRLVIKLTK